jgi:uncharacterized protein YggE
MNTRWKIAAAAVLAAGVAAVATIAMTGGGDDVATATVPPDSTQTTEDEMERSITVTGHGKVEVTPDVADLWLGVQATAPTGDEVMTTVEQKSRSLVDALKGAGIEDRDIQTSGLSLYPNYSQNGQRITGYTASVDVSVRARDLDRVGELLDTVQGLVGDQLTIGGISFSYEDPEAVLEQARAAAIENARVRAAQYAEAAGVGVGDIVRIVESSSAAPPIPYAAERVAADGAVPIEPGSQELTADVTVVFGMA